MCEQLRRRHARGYLFSIVVVADGATPKEGTMEVVEGGTDEFGHVRLGGIGHRLEPEIEQRTGFETRTTVLGHILRGGTPTAYDRVLATKFGLAAINGAVAGGGGHAALRGMSIELVTLEEAVRELKTVPDALLRAVHRAAGLTTHQPCTVLT